MPGSSLRWSVGGLAGLLLLATVVGLVALWPRDSPGLDLPTTSPVEGRVVALRSPPCSAQIAATGVERCLTATFRVTEGRLRGRTGDQQFGSTDLAPVLDVGQRVRLQPLPPAAVGSVQAPFTFVSVDRRSALLWLVVAFAVLVVLFARLKGALALVGFAASLALVTTFVVPAILAGRDPVLVALVGSLAVMWVTVLLTYGVGPRSLAAALGIALSLAAGALLARLWVGLADLDGRSGELSGQLSAGAQGPLSLQGVLLAGIVIGALGVLADTGVTQASAVMALRRANPRMRALELYREASSIGRDHLTATVHTLVLAYVGGSLPLLLVLRGTGVSAVDAVASQDLAEPIVATLIGSIALLLSVPLTTGLTTLIAMGADPGELPADDGHGHGHAP